MNYFTFKKYIKKSGSLLPISFKNDIPFKTKRIFLIYGNKNFVRGNHAHKKCSQFFFPLNSNIKIYLDNGIKEKEILLKHGEIKRVDPLTWVRVKLKKNQIIGVFCNKKYSKNDYIRNYKNFKNYIKK